MAASMKLQEVSLLPVTNDSDNKYVCELTAAAATLSTVATLGNIFIAIWVAHLIRPLNYAQNYLKCMTVLSGRLRICNLT